MRRPATPSLRLCSVGRALYGEKEVRNHIRGYLRLGKLCGRCNLRRHLDAWIYCTVGCPRPPHRLLRRIHHSHLLRGHNKKNDIYAKITDNRTSVSAFVEREAKKEFAMEHIVKALKELGFPEYVREVLASAGEMKESLKVSIFSVNQNTLRG